MADYTPTGTGHEPLAMAAEAVPTGTYDQPVFVHWQNGTDGYLFDNDETAFGTRGLLVGAVGLLSATADSTGVQIDCGQKAGPGGGTVYTLGISSAMAPGWTQTRMGYASSTGAAGFHALYSIRPKGSQNWYATDSELEHAYYQNGNAAELYRLGFVKPSTLDMQITKGGNGKPSNDHAGQKAVLHYGASLVIGINTQDWPSAKLVKIRFYRSKPTTDAEYARPVATYTASATDPNIQVVSVGNATLHVSEVGNNQLFRIADSRDNVASDIWYAVDFTDSSGATHTLDPELTNKTGNKNGGGQWGT